MSRTGRIGGAARTARITPVASMRPRNPPSSTEFISATAVPRAAGRCEHHPIRSHAHGRADRQQDHPTCGVVGVQGRRLGAQEQQGDPRCGNGKPRRVDHPASLTRPKRPRWPAKSMVAVPCRRTRIQTAIFGRPPIPDSWRAPGHTTVSGRMPSTACLAVLLTGTPWGRQGQCLAAAAIPVYSPRVRAASCDWLNTANGPLGADDVRV